MEQEKIIVTVGVPGNMAESQTGDAVLMVVIDGKNARTCAVSHGTTANTLAMGASIGIAALIRDICEQTGALPETILKGIEILL